MGPDMQTTIVIPCYNEEKRLPIERLLAFTTETADVNFLLINDGSTDGTAQVIDGLGRMRSDKIKTVNLTANQGKGEAVRQGLITALEGKSRYVGYWDADLSAPLSEILHLRQVLMKQRSLDAVIGSRVKLIGRIIERKSWRHYISRIIATLISMALRLPVYDTQCGAKIFRASPKLKSLLAEPFLTRWLFDVEIIARSLLSFARRGDMSLTFHEEPLESWADVDASKIGISDFPIIMKELWLIWCGYTLKLCHGEKTAASQLTVRQPRKT